MEKHTPGPFTVRTSPHISLQDVNYRELMATTEDGDCVLGEVFYSDVGEEFAAANATLFAAAPDLLKAAIRHVAAVKALGARSDTDTERSLFDERPMSEAGAAAWLELNDAGRELSAAIAKATGAGA